LLIVVGGLVQKSRAEILNILKRRDEATLEELAAELKLAPITVRSHVAVLQRDGLVTVSEVRGRVGRPHYVFTLTEQAHDLFPQSYDVLANRLLDAVETAEGPDGVARLLARVAECWAAECAPQVAARSLADRVAAVARLRDEEGSMARWEPFHDGYLLYQENCSLYRVARRYPQVCRAELTYLTRLLDAEVVRMECQLDGRGQCTYLIRPR
jgi:predicted ArsR family transcriptional regulator